MDTDEGNDNINDFSMWLQNNKMWKKLRGLNIIRVHCKCEKALKYEYKRRQATAYENGVAMRKDVFSKLFYKWKA